MSEAPAPAPASEGAGIKLSASHRISERWLAGLVAVLLCGLFVSWFILSIQLPTAFFSDGVGPAMFPKLISGIGAILAVVMLVSAITISNRIRYIEFGKLWTTLGFVLLLPIYAALMNATGFYVASLTSLPLIILLAGGRSWLMLVSAPILFCLFVYICFEMAMGVPVP
jgi:hypothetical protein